MLGIRAIQGESIWRAIKSIYVDSISLAYQSRGMVHSTRVDSFGILRDNVYNSLCRNTEQITLTVLSKLVVC